MKLKLIFLLIGSIFLTYIIYNSYENKTINILSIYDITTTNENNYNNYLKNILNKDISFNYQIYAKENFEIENVVANISMNKNKIQEKIYNSNIVIISLGDFELLRENVPLSVLTMQLDELFKQVKKLNNKQIIYLSPINIKSSYALKTLCNKYKIYFINTNSYLNEDDITNYILNDSGSKKASNAIYKTISAAWQFDKQTNF